MDFKPSVIEGKPGDLIDLVLKNKTRLRIRAESLDIKDDFFFGFTEDGRRFVVPVENVNFSVEYRFET